MSTTDYVGSLIHGLMRAGRPGELWAYYFRQWNSPRLSNQLEVEIDQCLLGDPFTNSTFAANNIGVDSGIEILHQP
jgi:hypothetical protein